MQSFTGAFQKFGLLDKIWTNKGPSNRNSLKSRVPIKFEQKLWDHSFKISVFWFQLRDFLKHVDCSTSNLVFSKINFPKKKSSKTKTPSNRWSKSNLSRSYEVTNSRYQKFCFQSRDHFKYVDCSTASLMTNKRSTNRNSLKQRAQIKFRQKSCSHYSKCWHFDFSHVAIWKM